ncbi:hypothetical protein V1294_001639 [Bradyrhizobium sp. AZCC 1678]|uniref:PLD phosphodiesterase domain-containing protein n=1 Tax=Bradyrhizobium algeriense TaxID=634784 RepID=A0ABU8B3E0_9BRAD
MADPVQIVTPHLVVRDASSSVVSGLGSANLTNSFR